MRVEATEDGRYFDTAVACSANSRRQPVLLSTTLGSSGKYFGSIAPGTYQLHITGTPSGAQIANLTSSAPSNHRVAPITRIDLLATHFYGTTPQNAALREQHPELRWPQAAGPQDGPAG